MLPRPRLARLLFAVVLGALCVALSNDSRAAPLDTAPAPRAGAADVDQMLLADIKARAEIMKNLEYLSDRIGGRLTGSANLEKANKWTAEKMKAYGLENVRLDPWEIPYGWERGRAEMRLVEPDTGRTLHIASRGWAPGTKGKITADVVLIKNPRTTDDLKPYKGKLKGAVVMLADPTKVAPVTDLNYGGAPPTKDGEKKGNVRPPRPKEDFGAELMRFLKDEQIACHVSDAGKPHGLLVTTGGWGTDRAAAEGDYARVFMAHEHYALLHRLVTQGAKPRVELEITNKFIPGPITVYNTIGEVRGSDKPDEIVVVGAHLDSWELATGTTDNGTGTCVVLETARAVAKLAKEGHRPKRTIRFCLFTGEEQGLWGSRKYVEKYKADLPKHSVALVHDTGTGKVLGFGVQERDSIIPLLEPELKSLKGVDGWKGLERRGMKGGTDHWPFEQKGVPGFACRQDWDEYRLTHHTQSDTFDKAKEPNLIQGAQVMAVTAVRIANLPDLLPRNDPRPDERPARPAPKEKG